MDDIEPKYIAIAVGVVIVVALLSRSSQSAGVAPYQVVPSDPGLDAIAQQEVNARANAFTGLLAYAQTVDTARIGAFLQESLAETQRVQTEDVAKIQSDLEKSRIGAAASVQKNAANKSFWGGVVSTVGNIVGGLLHFL